MFVEELYQQQKHKQDGMLGESITFLKVKFECIILNDYIKV